MKRILITGAGSYVGMSFEKWINKYLNKYTVDTLDMRIEEWRRTDFSQYDIVFHVAGIAHIKTTKANKALYYKINTELAIETAIKAKETGVKQFIFMSSMSSMYMSGVGVKKTVYGESKYLAEQEIKAFNDTNFKVAILKPPMIYGKGCRGNYPRLASLAKKIPIFPDYINERSMIYIDNFSEFVRLLIDTEDSGEFYPQNIDYVNTSELVKLIAQMHGKKVHFTKLFNPFITLFKDITLVSKIFGNLVYDKQMSVYKHNYNVVSFYESIKSTEKAFL